MEISKDTIYTFKLNSGEEMVTKVLDVKDTHYVIEQPVSIAPGQNGMQMIPSAFTMELQKTSETKILMQSQWCLKLIQKYKLATKQQHQG